MSLILIERIANLNGPIIPDTLNGVLNGSEIDAHKFVITATRDGATVALTGTVTASFLRADGAEVVLTGEIEDGAATVTLAQSCYAVPGRFDLTIFVTADGVKTGVYACTGGVRNTTSGTIIDPGQIVPSVDDIIAKQEELAQDVADASSAIASAQNATSYLAPGFSTSKTYEVGEYVTQDGALYICTTAIDTAGAWDAAKWQSVTFGVELADLKGAIEFQEDEQSKIADDLYGSHDVYMGYQLGRYATNGYNYSLHSYMYSIKLPAGWYYFPEIDSTYDFSAIQYVSDSEGVTVFTYRYRTTTVNLPANCIVSVRKVNGQDLTATEIKNIIEMFRIKRISSESGALDTLTEMSGEVFGEDNPVIDISPVQGYYLSGGFGGETSAVRWRTKNKIPAGTYRVTNSDPDYRYYWVDYVSDSRGTVVFNSRSDDVLYTDGNDFYITFCQKDLNSITASDVTSRFTLQKIQTSNSIKARVDRLYSKQKVVFMGDSIFGMERSFTSIPDLCGYYTGATTYNCAIGGTAALEHPNDYKYFDLGLLTDAIISGDFTNQIAHQADSGNPTYIPGVISTLQSLDFSTVDMLVISIGGNDWVMNFGTNAQIFAAIETTINKMLTAFPNLRVIVMAPPFKFKLDGQGEFQIDCDTWVNNTGTTFSAFARQYTEIGEVCHVPIINAMDDLGINRYNRSQWFIAGDGSHPNETGRRETAKLVSEYLKRYLYD